MKIINHDLTAIILCGGKGERLKPLTNTIPKPLVHINGKPILGYLIDHLKRFGIRRYIIAVGYRANQIIEYCNEDYNDLEMQFVDSGDVDIIQRILDSSNLISGDFLLLYGDTLADVNINKLVDFHNAHPGLLTITSYRLQTQFGIVSIEDNGYVNYFNEKPVLDIWYNIGYFYFDYSLVKNYTKFEKFLEYFSEKSEVYSYKHKNIHITVNTIKELEDAEKNLKKLDI